MKEIILSTYHLIRNWQTVCRTIGWLLAVLVVYRRRAYFEIALAILEHFARSRERRWNDGYGY
ncbi:hypothetical protein ACXR0O_23615 [Verrucomicrobiota bacterium sgz303538]